MAVRFLALTYALSVVVLPAKGYFLSHDRGHSLANHHDATESWQLTSFGKPDESAEPKRSNKTSKPEERQRNKKHYNVKEALEVTDSHKYPFIAFLHHTLEHAFGKISEHWWQDWKLWVGLTLWLAVWAKWLTKGYDEIYFVRAAFAFGINIVILHILQYSSTIKMGMVLVCALLAGQAVVTSVFWFKSESHDSETPRAEKFECDTMYLDFSLPVEQIIVLFVAQCIVWWFYMTSILGNFDFRTVNYMFWLVAFLAMQMTMIFNRGEDSVLGNPFPVHEVHKVIINADKIKFTLEGAGGHSFRLTKTSIIMRGVMGYFCNSILREIMAYTIPLMLMGFAEPMDFVVYCVGVNFICTLDDMAGRTFIIDAKDDLETESTEKKSVAEPSAG